MVDKPKDDPPKDDPPKDDDPNEEQWQALEGRVKTATRATLDEWWAEKQAEAKKAGGGITLDFGPIGSLLGFKAK